MLLLCSPSVGKGTDRVGFLNMTSNEMFPNDRKIRSLALAASDGDIESIDKLLASGVDVNAVGGRGLPAAFWVLYHPNEKGFAHLLKRGADPNMLLKTTFAGRQYYTSLIHQAAGLYVDFKYLKMILEIGNGNPNLVLPDNQRRPIGEAVFPGHEKSFAALYNAGAKIDYSSKHYSLLYLASLARNYQLIYFLLEKGVDFKSINSSGHDLKYAFEMSIVYERPYIDHNQWFWRSVAFLEKRGVHVDIPADMKRPTNLDNGPPPILKLINKETTREERHE
ncbi:ankyrin repeat domain-containing protein [Salidesulfovibrio brasiliensis]|uniref:ankyrin repeat domain-containing protein n=1 Tax=Salidesulfovibrio brasiliensis TaxID=221711 RepID=UPI0012EEBC50|nr:hypothetical protein [Salidesulfovibrio brasiliensis]